MLPTKSNTADKGCAPVSSNCVIWQGPSLSCINLCNGDTVSDVVYKLAVELCDLQAHLDLSDLDLSCVVQACQTCPEPVKTLSAVLDLIITKTCDIEQLITDLQNGTSDYIEPNLTLPACLQYVNAQGQNVTSVAHTAFSSTMATKVCAMNTLVNNHTSQITGHENRIVVLENKTTDLLPTIVPNCIYGTDTTAKTLNLALDTLEDQFCVLRGTLGTTTAITAAAAQQCAGLAQASAFGQNGTLGNITGWKTSVTTLADSFNNLWITVCDIRSAVKQVIDSGGGSAGCAGFLLKFSAYADNTRQNVTIIFNNYALSNTERQLLEGNLAWETNINTQLPPTHPYYNVPPKSQITPETYEIQLNNWNSNITVGTLYLYDTQTNTFLTNITSIYSDETNQYFPQSRFAQL